MEQLKGIHHVTAITSGSERIYEFYTNVLGMRMVKKNVNQDDVSTYHLYFADDRGNPGTAMTFFDFKGIGKHQPGTNEISRTGFRVANDAAIDYWVKRLYHYHVKHEQVSELFGKKVLFFEDFDEQQYAIFSDEDNQGIAAGEPWYKGPVPNEYAILGLGPVFLRVNRLEEMNRVLVEQLGMRKVDTIEHLSLYEMGMGGNGASVIVDLNTTMPYGKQGYGGVHHIAFRVENRDVLNDWEDHLNRNGLRHSGFVERFYFGSLYSRMYPSILFELATDGPGFIDDEESYEILGEKVTLPPHLRPYREEIMKQLEPFDTIRSNRIFEKEYFNE